MNSAAADTDTDLAIAGATLLHDGFADYHARFADVTRRARQRFEMRDWAAARLDAVERIELYDLCVAESSAQLRALLGAQADDRALWHRLRNDYAALIAPLIDQELYKTFFNTLTRRFFRTRGVDPEIEFVALDIEPTDRITHPVARHVYAASEDLAALVHRLLEDFPFATPYADAARSARLIADSLQQQLADWGPNPVRALELLTTVFYRERRAYLVGRVFGEQRYAPCVIALVNDDDGIRADRLEHLRAGFKLSRGRDVGPAFDGEGLAGEFHSFAQRSERSRQASVNQVVFEPQHVVHRAGE